MRTTLTLDDDVAARLQAEAKRSGRAFRDVVNETLRRGFLAKPSAQPVSVQLPTFRMELRPGVDLDHIAKVLGELDAPL